MIVGRSGRLLGLDNGGGLKIREKPGDFYLIAIEQFGDVLMKCANTIGSSAG